MFYSCMAKYFVNGREIELSDETKCVENLTLIDKVSDHQTRQVPVCACPPTCSTDINLLFCQDMIALKHDVPLLLLSTYRFSVSFVLPSKFDTKST